MPKQDQYGTLLTETKKVYSSMQWAESFDPELHGTEETNAWHLAQLGLKASAYFLGQVIKSEIEQQEGEVHYAGAQGALELFGDRPAGAEGMKAALAKFMESQESLGGVSFPTGHDDDEIEDPPAAEVRSLWARAEPDRGLPPVEVIGRYGPARPAGPDLGWCAGDRAAALRWCEAKIAGRDAPKPEAVAVTYLEDLDLNDREDSFELLNRVLSMPAEEAGLSDWSGEDLVEIGTWARASHRIDRGEDVDPEMLPTGLAPATATATGLHRYFDEGGVAESGIYDLMEEVASDDPGLGLLVEAAIACGGVEPDGSALRPTGHELPEPATLRLVATNLGSRLPAFQDVDEVPEHALQGGNRWWAQLIHHSDPEELVFEHAGDEPEEEGETEESAGEAEAEESDEAEPAASVLADDGVDASEGVQVGAS